MTPSGAEAFIGQVQSRRGLGVIKSSTTRTCFEVVNPRLLSYVPAALRRTAATVDGYQALPP